MEQKSLAEFRLIYRHTCVSEEPAASSEISLYLCQLGGPGYILEEVRCRPNWRETAMISMNAEVLAGLMPHLLKIVQEAGKETT